jgi:hypothetical protein
MSNQLALHIVQFHQLAERAGQKKPSAGPGSTISGIAVLREVKREGFDQKQL